MKLSPESGGQTSQAGAAFPIVTVPTGPSDRSRAGHLPVLTRVHFTARPQVFGTRASITPTQLLSQCSISELRSPHHRHVRADLAEFHQYAGSQLGYVRLQARSREVGATSLHFVPTHSIPGTHGFNTVGLIHSPPSTAASHCP